MFSTLYGLTLTIRADLSLGQVSILTLHTPQATVHSSLVAEAWLAWHSIPETHKPKPQQTALYRHYYIGLQERNQLRILYVFVY